MLKIALDILTLAVCCIFAMGFPLLVWLCGKLI